MKITLLTVGKTNFKFIKDGLAVYEKRLVRYIPFIRIEIPELKNVSSLSPDQIKKKEAELLLKKIKNGQRIILLDEKGKTFTSVKWAHFLEKSISNDRRDIIFIIGGAYGFAKEIYDIASDKLSLSYMTFSHQIVRLIFIEQLYRTFTIIKGEPYHNE
ncbi:MAG: 23S rRNA (pseudouridine(1915)-N(3))-methyltransferase RlmH [Bacteroidales bacterium]